MAVAIVQARMGSGRLPGKTLAEVAGKPMLGWVVERAAGCPGVTEVVVATTIEKRDEPIVEFAKGRGLRFFRGEESDVLDRFYQTAKAFGIRDILRVTPDCPLLDPAVIGRVVEAYRSGRYDYVSNTLGRRYPDGLDTELFSFQALETAWREARLASDREHVTSYLLRHPERFRIFSVEAPADYGGLKWSVDTQEDLDFVREVCAKMNGHPGPFSMEEVLRVADRPGQAVVNEGYYRSLCADPPKEDRPRRLDRSRALADRAQAVIPGGSQTFSKGPTQFVQGVAPSFIVRGSGCRVWDVDGNEYLDTGMALGSVILGYGDPEVDEAVREQLSRGPHFSLPHPLEVELAERLREMIPCAEMVRFGKNGSDVTSGAVRLARASTGRDLVAACGYHGWQDWYIGTTTRNRGVPAAVRDLTFTFEYNRIETLEAIFNRHPRQVAAVILEPMGVLEPLPGFLEEVASLTRREGALLIFDEVLTGFRFSAGGAQAYFGVTPDLACFGKAMANGLPLSALVGRREVMKLLEEVFFSFTFGGEALSLAAAGAALQKMKRERVIDHLWGQGRKLKDGYNILSRHYGLSDATGCVGFPVRSVIQFSGQDPQESLLMKSLFQQECLKRGVLFTGGQNPCASHGEAEVHEILRVYRSALEVLAAARAQGKLSDRLEGKPVEPVFRQA